MLEIYLTVFECTHYTRRRIPKCHSALESYISHYGAIEKATPIGKRDPQMVHQAPQHKMFHVLGIGLLFLTQSVLASPVVSMFRFWKKHPADGAAAGWALRHIEQQLGDLTHISMWRCLTK